jgi:HEAT repeat protein
MALSPEPRPAPDQAAAAQRRKTTLILALVAAACVLVPFLFWKQTWFGQPLSEDSLAQYLTDQEHPRHIQQALVQIEERIEHGDVSVQQWYPQVAALRDSPIVELRVTLAWVVGADTHSDLFHKTLLSMLGDSDLLVRRNAALSLVRFGDASGREEIRNIFQPTVVRAPAAGILHFRLKEGDTVESTAALARLERSGEEAQDVHSPVPGKLLRRIAADGSAVAGGQEIAAVSPGEDQVWEGLRALYLIGLPEDLPLIEPLLHSSKQDYSDKIRQQASLTAAAIRRRASIARPSEPRP